MRIVHSVKYITDNFILQPHPAPSPATTQSKEKVEMPQKNETEVIYQGKLQTNPKWCTFDTLKII